MRKLFDFATNGQQFVLDWQLTTRAGFDVIVGYGTLCPASAVGLSVPFSEFDVRRHLKWAVRLHDEHVLGRRVAAA